MDGFSTLFPPNDFALLALILAMPLLGAVVNGVFGKRLGKSAVNLMALSAVGTSFLASVVTYFMLLEAQSGDEPARFVWRGWEWFRLSQLGGVTDLPITVAFSVDALSGTMALVVTGVGFLIHLYSTKYMDGDPGYHRFFSYLNLFIFAMLVLILGDNLPVLFVGWEGVGLCSYLLIGFWFGEDKNAAAGNKAFITNRIGDFGLLVAMGLLLYYAGALDWDGIGASTHRLQHQTLQLWPIGLEAPGTGLLNALNLTAAAQWWNTPIYAGVATIIGLFLFLGCAGKSAQIPLYVWLPDAMAGPTPVSALIHAATMVTAGVYLVCRMAPVFVLSPFAMFVVALVGAVTAVFAASIAFAQKDIKKVLAYSTVSQLGYMFLGVGVGAFAAGFFHVITHAFFKGCLFLGAGSVIHAMHARIHDHDRSQDMTYMGGLRRYLPITFFTFLASWAAISGLPGTSGFFSKEEILLRSYTSSIELSDAAKTLATPTGPIEAFQWPSWAPALLLTLGLVGAVMTAFYMSRLVIGIFLGNFRGWSVVPNWAPSASDAHEHGDAGEHAPSSTAHAHAEREADADHPEVPLQGSEPRESPWQMTLPLVVLGGLALFAGIWHGAGEGTLEHALEPIFGKLSVVQVHGDTSSLEHLLMTLGISAFVLGAGAAYWTYVSRRGEPAKALAERWPGFYQLVVDKWRIDELYRETLIGAIELIADLSVWFDKWVVDGIIARLTAFCVSMSGALLRLTQTGRVQAYAAMVAVGLVAFGWFLVAPHATAVVDADDATGKYLLTASPGFGYSYRWDESGGDQLDRAKWSQGRSVEVELKRDESRRVVLEVRSALGQTARHSFLLERPKEDKSNLTTRLDVYRDEQGKPYLGQHKGKRPRGSPNDRQRLINALEQGGPQ